MTDALEPREIIVKIEYSDARPRLMRLFSWTIGAMGFKLSTGRIDKHGQRIFEGDTLKITVRTEPEGLIVPILGTVIWPDENHPDGPRSGFYLCHKGSQDAQLS